MKLKDIVNNLPKNEDVLDNYDLTNLLSNIYGVYLNIKPHNVRIKCYWLSRWLCTDTWVGKKIYYFDNQLLCIGYQPARKSSETFTFASKEIKESFRAYLLSMVEEEEYEADDENYLDLEEEYEPYFTLSYGCQLLDKEVIYDDKPCRVINVNRKDFRGLVLLQLPDKRQIEVDISLIKIYW